METQMELFEQWCAKRGVALNNDDRTALLCAGFFAGLNISLNETCAYCHSDNMANCLRCKRYYEDQFVSPIQPRGL